MHCSLYSVRWESVQEHVAVDLEMHHLDGCNPMLNEVTTKNWRGF